MIPFSKIKIKNSTIFFALAYFLLWTLIGSASKLAFMAMYQSSMGDVSLGDWCAVLYHGLTLDLAVAGYLTVVPCLLMIVAVWWQGKGWQYLWRTYNAIAATASSLAYVCNLGLYGYWGFPLDSTPLLYIKTSPSDAIASLTTAQLILAPLAVIILAVLIYLLFDKISRHFSPFFTPHSSLKGTERSLLRQPIFHFSLNSESAPSLRGRAGGEASFFTLHSSLFTTISLLLFTALLILPIRGGISTGTNHTGSVYFSSNIKLNHAAVNPIFCFVESVTHQQEDLTTKYRFMDDSEATALMQQLTSTASHSYTDSIVTLTATGDTLRIPLTEIYSQTPNPLMCYETDRMTTAPAAPSLQRKAGGEPTIVVIMLESFSKYIMTEGGHVRGVTPYLDRLTSEGLYFTNIYANSFRTDRGIVSILSGLPAQPTMSIMDLPQKSNRLPSLARTPSANGYTTTFYYGGDANYSNMRSYLMATGYQNVVSETDFSSSERTCKWGVPDGIVFQRMLNDIKASSNTSPMSESAPSPVGRAGGKAYTIMTVSSHEPFDAPYNSGMQPELNAFAYTDHCLGEFIEGLKALPSWQNTLVVIVPDHLGAYPTEIDNYQLWRYQIPLIFTGGIIRKPCRIPVFGGQTDIPATILSMLQLPHNDFPFSKDLLAPHIPHYAFFTVPDAMGFVDNDSRIIYDNTSSQRILSEGTAPDISERKAKALLQKLYDEIAK